MAGVLNGMLFLNSRSGSLLHSQKYVPAFGLSSCEQLGKLPLANSPARACTTQIDARIVFLVPCTAVQLVMSCDSVLCSLRSI